MLHSLFLASLLALLLPGAPVPTAQLVVPGRSIGSLRLGVEVAAAHLPTTPADFSDGAMMKQWLTWYDQGHPPTQLDVYVETDNAATDGDRHSAQVVRATSTYFRLANGLRNGSTLHQIEECYGRLPLASTYRLKAGPRYLYDDVARGIAFELAGTSSTSQCRALVVHLPGRAVANISLPMPIYLKDMPTRQ